MYIKANSKGICEAEHSFPLFSIKMLKSAFLLRFEANYLVKMCGYPNFSLWILEALTQIYVFRVLLMGEAQIPLYSVGTNLKASH